MEQTLLLNASYEPLKVVDWQKAITLWCQGKVEVIAVHDREIRSVTFSFRLPSVMLSTTVSYGTSSSSSIHRARTEREYAGSLRDLVLWA